MDAHQKISIGIFGALLLGTMAMYSTGSISSNALNANVIDATSPCAETYMRGYSNTYATDKAKIAELQQFVGRNCSGDIIESKKSYCDARKKQIVTYMNQVKKYEQCISGEVSVKK